MPLPSKDNCWCYFKLNHNGIGIVILKIAVVIIIVDNNMNKTGEIKKTKQQQQHR